MVVINFKTKWGDRLVQSDCRAKIFAFMLKERIEDGYWFSGSEEELASIAWASGQSEDFMCKRRDYEYEDYEDVPMEIVP